MWQSEQQATEKPSRPFQPMRKDWMIRFGR
jgi:hypothetical protein